MEKQVKELDLELYFKEVKRNYMQITNELIESLNKVIVTAIDHGGDDGGAYYTSPEKLYEAVELLLTHIDSSGKRLELIWDTHTDKVDGRYRSALLTDKECSELNADKTLLKVRDKRVPRSYDNTLLCKQRNESSFSAIAKCIVCQLTCTLAQEDCTNKCERYLSYLKEHRKD